MHLVPRRRRGPGRAAQSWPPVRKFCGRIRETLGRGVAPRGVRAVSLGAWRATPRLAPGRRDAGLRGQSVAGTCCGTRRLGLCGGALPPPSKATHVGRVRRPASQRALAQGCAPRAMDGLGWEPVWGPSLLSLRTGERLSDAPGNTSPACTPHGWSLVREDRPGVPLLISWPQGARGGLTSGERGVRCPLGRRNTLWPRL
ncbi:hypothetical protein Rumeso_02923 [Rubellimicrobium mesophilum DSM 19309]|uniref:Uncharacterized protein n=1 Tax=Rubellimicrobium mesophilum DSM 19309 TaxID=442562 RepID=A0A017HMZ1_9RHOB|nr:hypothetical protein Rumeso_02923 [Rubellimicrobium mesophilum DSM 19309]